MKRNYVCFVAGRSGGHIIPAITLAKQEKKNNKHILFFTTHKQLDTDIIRQEKIVDAHIPLKLDNLARNPMKLIRFLLQAGRAVMQTIFYLWRYKPEKIVAMGGYISAPVCVAGKLMRVPIELYELNAVPGKAAKALAPFARTVFVCFQETKVFFNSKKCRATNYPVRFGKTDISKKDAYTKCFLTPNKKTIFILGGSQGSLEINRKIKQLIENKTYNPETVQFIHQTGKKDETNWQAFYKQYGFQAFVFDYYPHLEYCWTIADLVICRAGAGTLFEALHFQKKCLIHPLITKTTTHQQENALAMIRAHPNLFS